ncbi:unnamed protein product [Haemonchus placei]|uniref:Uncharacterized protein n=1 Tax=Haemonchus placei TaxID=6290 RepID=A0A0N4X914_HAEPC|nr:unnamed protein product [Haemonchus placei]
MEDLEEDGAGGRADFENGIVMGFRKKVRESRHNIIHHLSFHKFVLDPKVK